MEYLIKASAVIILFYLCFSLFLKKETFFQHNRWFLLIGLMIAMIFPLIVIPVYIPVEPIVIPETTSFVQAIPTNIVMTQAETAFDWSRLLPLIYGIGFTVFLIQFILQFGSLVLLLAKNPKYKDELFTYVIIKNKISPFSFFKWIVYNPNTFDENELDLILTHEKVHAKQLHSIDLLLMQLACVIFWFNPLIWLYRNEVRQNLEYIADSKTQASSADEKEYQHLLLKTSIANHNISLSNNFYNSLIKERIVMLKKSRSNKKKQWRYLLMLPLLAGLLMSMNTETVYVETETKITNKDTVEFVVTKNTTDKELKTMSDAVENKGGTLTFSNIKRNSTNELTSIFLKLNNHSYGGGSSNSPIDSFIIYKELFDRGGGYVGRINGATMHFDDNTNDKKIIDALKERAHKAILNSGIQNKGDLNSYKQKYSNNKNKEKSKEKETSKPTKKASVKKPNKSTKNIAMAIATPVKLTSQPVFIKDISTAVITKNTTNAELEGIKKDLKKEGLTVKFKGVKRNKSSEITAIKIDVKSKRSSTNYQINSDDEAIKPIKIVFDSEKNSISIGNGHVRHGENTYVYKTKGSKHKLHKSGSGNNHVYIISEDEYDEEDEEHEHDSPKFIIKSNGKKGKIKKIKSSSSNVHVISDDDDNEVIEIIVDEDDDNKETIIVNGKRVNVVGGRKNIVVKGKKVNVVKGTAKNVWVTNVDDMDDTFVFEIDDSKKNVFITNDNGKSPLYIIDGKEVSKDAIVNLNSDAIESVTILKDKSAIKKYGKKAKDGVIIIKTKKN